MREGPVENSTAGRNRGTETRTGLLSYGTTFMELSTEKFDLPFQWKVSS